MWRPSGCGMRLYEWEVEDDWLLGCYALGALLLVLYFACEGGTCHRSQKCESLYLSIVIFVVYWASMLWREGHHLPCEAVAVVRLRQLVRFSLALHLFVYYVFPHPHHEFHAETSAAGPAILRHPDAGRPSVMAMHTAQELEDLLAEALDQTAWRGPLRWLAGPALLPILFIARMFEDTMLVAEVLANALELPLLVLLVTLHVCAFWAAAMKLRAWSSCRDSIHELLMDLVQRGAKPVLRHVLTSASVATLIEVARWQTVSELIAGSLSNNDMLCTQSKAALISALQVAGSLSKRRAREAVVTLLKSCELNDLTRLKNLIDGSGTYHNLYKLVYNDITCKAMRRSILEHIELQAMQQRLHLGGAVGMKLLSDIDDTLKCSGGRFPAGCDRRYPHHAVYPGFLQLLRILDRQWSQDQFACNIVFLTARPHVYKDVMEEQSFGLFRNFVSTGWMHSLPTLLPGRLLPGLFAACTAMCLKRRAWRWVGRCKYATYLGYKDLYPEYDFAFFGDDGQGDHLAGQAMIAEQGRRLASRQASATASEAGARSEPRSRTSSGKHEVSVWKKPYDSGCPPDAVVPSTSPSLTSSPPPPDDEAGSGSDSGPSVSECLAGDFPRLRFVVIQAVVAEAGAVQGDEAPKAAAAQPLAAEATPAAGAGGSVDASPGESMQMVSSATSEFAPPCIEHRSYVGAALDLHCHNNQLVSAKDLASVIDSAAEEFDAIRWAHPQWSEERWAAAEMALRRDIARAEPVLQEAGFPPPQPLRTVPELRSAEETAWRPRAASTTPKASGRRRQRRGDRRVWAAPIVDPGV